MQPGWPRKTLLPLCTTAIAIALVPTVFRPIESALLHWAEMSFGFGELFELLALPFLLLTGIAALVGAALLLLARSRAMALPCALLVCLWIQGSFLVWDYGVFDGTAIDWSRHSGKGLIEVLLWLAVFGVALARPQWLGARATAIAIAVTLFQTAGLIATYSSHAPFDTHLETSADPGSEAARAEARERAVTSFSAERNALVLVLDTLQSDFFAELIADPDFAETIPPGFRYYRNAVAPYPHTQHSLPAMLTAMTPAQHPRPRWTVDQMKRSVAERLAERGWLSSVVTTTPPYLACNQHGFAFGCQSQRSFAAKQTGALSSRRDLDRADDARALLRIAAFRVVPHIAKPWVYDEGRWRVPDPFDEAPPLADEDERIWYETRRDLSAWRRLIDEANPGAKVSTFKFLHFFAAHHPSSITGDCAWNGLDNPEPSQRDDAATRDRGVALEASRCALSRSFDFLARLDQLGVYDASLIFIVGDHGRQHTPIDPSLAQPPLPHRPSHAGSPPAHPSKGVPLVLVKRIGERTPLQISDAPVSLCDLPQSIFSEFGYEHDFACESLFEVENERRSPRLHFRGMNQPTGARFQIYRVDDHSWHPDSWLHLPAN